MKKIISITAAMIIASSIFLISNTASACGCGGPMPYNYYSQPTDMPVYKDFKSKEAVIYIDGGYFDHKAYKTANPNKKNKKAKINYRVNNSVVVDGFVY